MLLRSTVLTGIVLSLSTQVVSAEGLDFANTEPSTPIKVGFAFDKGFGVTARSKRYNAFIGNNGFTADYHFVREAINIDDFNMPFHWFIGAGGYYEWGGTIGARTPIGVDLQFAKRFDTYVQIIPELELRDDVKFGASGAIGIRYQF